MGWKHAPRLRHPLRRARRAVALVMSAVSGVLTLLPGAAVTAGVAAVAATAAMTAAPVVPANAATGTPVLVLLQNGETTAPEATVLQNAGYSVTQDTPTQWLALTAAQFKAYAAVVIGDPSSGSCSTLTPTTATSGTDAIGTIWQSAVTGNLAVIGTAPALPGSAAANTLVTDSVAYAAAGWNSSTDTGTGLYVSLNCEYSTSAANTAVPLLDGVEGISSSNGLTVQGSLSCSDSGTVNGWGAADARHSAGTPARRSLPAARRGRRRPARSRKPSTPGPARPRPGRRGLSPRWPTTAPATPPRTSPPPTGRPGSHTSCSPARPSRPPRSRRPPAARCRPKRRRAGATPRCPG